MVLTARGLAKWVSLALVVVVASSALGVASRAQGSISGPTPSASSTLRIGALQEPDSLNPNTGVLSASYAIWAHVYELLVGIGPDLTPIPALAASWEHDSTNKIWTFHLQQGVLWHDGVEFTAEDVNFTLRFLAPAVPGNAIGCDQPILGSYLGDASKNIGVDVANITVLDKYTIRVPTFQPKANILSMFIFMLPEHIWSQIRCSQVGHVDNLPPIGTGMYKFTTWVRGAYIQLALNDKYWRLDPTQDYVDQIIYIYYQDPTGLFNAFKSGDIDATAALNPGQFTQMPLSVAGGTDNVHKYAVDTVGFAEMGACVASDNLINSWGKHGGRSWLVTNLTVRQALQIAVNRSFLVQNIEEGLAKPGSTIIPPATPYWHYNVTTQEEYAYNPARARALLDDPAGNGVKLKDPTKPPGDFGENVDPAAPENQDAFVDMDGDHVRDVVNPSQVVAGDQWGTSAPNRDPLSTKDGGLTLDISIINTDTEAQDAVIGYMVGWWAQVGIKVVPGIVSESRQLGVTYSCSASLYTWGWGGDVDPNFLLSVMTTDQILYWQDAWYSNKTYDDLFLAQQTQVDLRERQQTVWRMQQILYRDAPYLIMWYFKILTVVRTDTFTGWGDWEAHPGLGLTGFGNDLVMLTLRAGSQANQPPTKPIIEGPSALTAFVGVDQNFVGTASDPENDPLDWIWSWGDGNTTRLSTASGIGQVSTTHNWSSTGIYTVTLTVDDSTNVVTSDPVQVTVVPLTSETGTIAGTVTDTSNNQPVESASVTVSPGGFTQTTDAQGHYSLVVPVGTYTVTASRSLYGSVSKENIDVAAAQTTTVDFALAPSRGWIGGTATSTSGGVLAGVSVRVTGAREYTGTTNAEGRYNITVAPGTYTITATLQGYQDKTVSGVPVSDGAATTVDLAMVPVLAPSGGLSTSVVIGTTAAVIVIIGVSAWAISRRRRKAEQIEAPSMPPKPPSGP